MCAATVQRAEMGLLVGGYISVFFYGLLGCREERWHEVHGVGIGTPDDAALEETSCVHHLVSRRSWKGSTFSDTCLVHSVAPERSALLRECFELPLLCTPTVSVST